jgi:CCAAT/enhancer binding protein (C/EBP), invertebrate
MYDNHSQLQSDLKKGTMAATNNNNNAATPNNNNNNNNSNNNNNNSATAINQNALAIKQQQQQQQLHQQAANNNNNNNNSNNNNNNLLLQKHMLSQIQYSQSDLEELTSQEISLDLQHLIDDQFRDPESLGIFTEMVNVGSTNGNNVAATASVAAKALQLQQAARLSQQQQQQQQQQTQQQTHNQGYPRSQLAYMPQPVHTGASYTNNSSDDNSSVGSDGTNIKEEPSEAVEFRRQLAQNGVSAAQFMGNANTAAALYQLPANYVSNGSGNSFTALTPSTVLGHHQGLPHIPPAHLANLKHKQSMLPHRSSNGSSKNSLSHQNNKHVDKGTDEYRRRRERNNIAVRKSREKAKVRSREVEEKVKNLIKEKDSLIRRLEEMTNEIQLHKQLYMHLMNHSNPEINQICRSALNLVNMNDHGM